MRRKTRHVLTSRLGHVEGLRLSELAAVGRLGAVGLDLVGGTGSSDKVGELVLALLSLDIVLNGELFLAAGLAVDEDKLELLGVGVDVVPLDGVGLGQVPLVVLLGLSDLERWRYDAVSKCLGPE